MSAVRCDYCDRLFNSDDDPDCFVELGRGKTYRTEVLCAACRDLHEKREEEDETL